VTPDAAWVNAFSDREVTAGELGREFAGEFAGALGADIVQGSLSEAEEARTDALIAGRYSTDDWNLRK
jgi:lipoate-protein ligase A